MTSSLRSGLLVLWLLFAAATALVSLILAVMAERLSDPALHLEIGLLLAFLLLSGILSTRTAWRWSRGLRQLARDLQEAPAGRWPMPGPTGLRELDSLVTAVNEAGSAFAEAQQQAEAALQEEAFARIATGLSRELEAPLVQLRQEAEALHGARGNQAEALDGILARLDQLEAMAWDLQAITQPVEINPVPVDLHRFIGECLEGCRAEAASRRIVLDWRSALPEWTLDLELLGHALDNLLRYALRQISPGGRIGIRATPAEEGCRLVVAYTGPQLSPTQEEELFVPFATDAGAALAAARKIVLAHGAGWTLRSSKPIPASRSLSRV